jgi:hypothetical protein
VRRLVMTALVGALLAAVAPVPHSAATAEDPGPDGPTVDEACAEEPVRGDEPPCNPHLAASVWSANHANAYAQGSSSAPGPVGPPEELDVHHAGILGVPIVLTFSPPYPDGGYVTWGSTVGFTGEVFKIDPDTVSLIDRFRPPTDAQEPPQEAGMTGAYNILDADNHLIVARQQALEVYADEDPTDRHSPIIRRHRFDLPDEALCRPGSDESVIGINMTYDGHVVFATSLGNVGAVPRWVDRMGLDELAVHRINGDACDDPAVPDEELEQVANTISTDETGGVFVITSTAMHRLQWDGALRSSWSVPYDVERGSGGSLGPGSGASPTLMGTRPDDDRLVVIYDDAAIFNLVLLWRDEIPEDWPGLAGEDRRIACKVPVDFGLDDDEAWSEQSPLVRGNAVVLVNDRMQAAPALELFPSRVAGWTQLAGGVPGNEPRGVERIDWNPATRTCQTVWQRPDLSIPNTIPTMSAATDTFYAVGVRDGNWTLEALDFETGEDRFHVPTSFVPTQNSMWAATTVGPDASIWSGTFGGVTRWQQCPSDAEECGRRPSLVEHLIGDPTSALP